jgi:DNA-binding NarL/FixJ family response regulator
MTTESEIRVLVCDDQEVIRSGVRAMVDGTEIKVVCEATTGEGAIKEALQNDINLLLLDVCMPDGDGLTVLHRVKLEKPDQAVVMFSAFDNPASVARSIALGAGAFLLKDCGRDEFLRTIRAVAKGENVWSRDKMRSISGALRTPRITPSLEISLSEREAEVLRLMAAGSTNKQIAQTMNISYETVKEHVQHVLRKIGLTDRTQAAVWALRNGLLGPYGSTMLYAEHPQRPVPYQGDDQNDAEEVRNPPA